MNDWRARARRLVDELTDKEILRSRAWQQAMAEVPRHVLVPVVYEYTPQGWQPTDTTSPHGRDRWLSQVYSNTALFTLPDGLSSSSQPSLMARMLEALDIHDGHKVLEIGTGTGYNAALLSHRLGDGHVYSVDIEPALVDLARERLAALGYRPVLATGNGAEGLTEHAPYDRLIATCSVSAIPWPWVEQVRHDGLILADVKPALAAGNLVLLRRHDDRAEGRFDARFGAFMAMRNAGGPPERVPQPRRDRSIADLTTTSLDLPRPWESQVFWFFSTVHARLRIVHYGQRMDSAGRPGDDFLVDKTGAWCEISSQPDEHGKRAVWQAGPRRIWDDIEAAHQHWEHLGRPGWERFGLTVTENNHTIWLDNPSGAYTWVL